ncbi:hypothetical protein ERX37_05970 [Macrococcus hajekii]|uniref:LURP-one-related family protein n=1 Tax=Macrococcus hajekii TaxID=198482 RepID=A0A4R6BJJ3_9STAP|nr:LURP-one-related family protein [Macrococcus hajekii]TDM01756.1 hypothetical protein ERX37_05970 [Macrococcus hajekii]GGB07176.1 hypothetical protein GCM10007190_14010 [Macrococcus hajekii]
MKLYAKQQAFSWHRNFDFFDEDGEVVYIANGRADLLGRRKISLMDSLHHEELALIKQQAASFNTTMDVFVQGEQVLTVRKKALSFIPVYLIEGEDWVVEGSIFAYDYTIKDSMDRVIARISKKLMSLNSAFEIDIQEPTAEVTYILSIVLTIQLEMDRAAAASTLI